MTKSEAKDRPLTIAVRRGKLIISVGIGTLARAAGESLGPWDDDSHEFLFRVVDETRFARDVARELQHECESDSTELTDLLDRAMRQALENGSLGCEVTRHAKTAEHER